MSDLSGREEKLARLVDRTIRDLPQRRAPDSLEVRVLGELQRRTGFPWWRHHFAHWPLLARTAVMAVCGALVPWSVLGGWAEPQLPVLNALGAASWIGRAVRVIASLDGLATWLDRMAPPPWLYFGLSVCAVFYVILFGLGAAVYRTLYLPSFRQPHHE